MFTEILTKERFISILEEYYSIKLKYNIHFVYELDVKYTDITVIPDIKIYFERYIMGDRIRVLVRDSEIKEAMDNYACNHGFELLSFKYVGNVQRAGYIREEDTPIFDGIALSMVRKNKGKTRTRKK